MKTHARVVVIGGGEGGCSDSNNQIIRQTRTAVPFGHYNIALRIPLPRWGGMMSCCRTTLTRYPCPSNRHPNHK